MGEVVEFGVWDADVLTLANACIFTAQNSSFEQTSNVLGRALQQHCGLPDGVRDLTTFAALQRNQIGLALAGRARLGRLRLLNLGLERFHDHDRNGHSQSQYSLPAIEQ